MNEFYENIEEPIRELVKILRDNGINTTCSCGHKMYIEADLVPDGTLQVIHKLVFNYLAEAKLPIEYDIEVRLEARKGLLWRTFVYINLKPNV